MTTLQDRLSALADAAPTELPDGLWERGLRYRRRRRIPTITVVVLAVLLAAAATLLAIGRTGAAPEPAETKDVPFEALHLPRTFYQPSPWAAGTTEPPGPLAAIASAPRLKRTGPFGVRQTGSAYGL
ncbi:MAG TPA: hypothetical protein VLI04_01700, partial [Nocardioidaceae bacterium]|nr:hypothetical protein [Nocardioidaceae bacterium]